MKKISISLYAAVTVALLGWAWYQAIYVAPEEQTMHEAQRIFYYHVPSAMVAFLFFAISLAGSIGFLAFRLRLFLLLFNKATASRDAAVTLPAALHWRARLWRCPWSDCAKASRTWRAPWRACRWRRRRA